MKIIFREKGRFEDYLKKTDVKLTVSRKIVFDKVMHAHGHFTAEDLVKLCRRNNRPASRATVYRTLKELLEAGIVRETAFGEKHQCFEHVYDEKLHHHARCVRCHTVIEFADQNEDKRYRPVLENKGFHILGHEMHFYGICQKCNVKEN